MAPIEMRQNWCIPGHAAVLLEPHPAAGADDPAGGEGEETEEEETRRDGRRRLGAA